MIPYNLCILGNATIIPSMAVLSTPLILFTSFSETRVADFDSSFKTQMVKMEVVAREYTTNNPSRGMITFLSVYYIKCMLNFLK